MQSFFLVDCNNFFASCEKVFNPSLEGIPLVILSNNDGCVIARSKEAKLLGIGMGDPFFKIRDFCKQRNVAVYSSNYELYGDLSQRVMRILIEFAPEIEIYSIDEAFLKFPFGMGVGECMNLGIEIKKKIQKWLGLPVSVGIAPTKTLAKLANSLAKKDVIKGVFDLTDESSRGIILKRIPIGEVWGIGSRWRSKLQAQNIHTVADFIHKDALAIRRLMGVVGERMLWELRGISCLGIEEVASKKSITCSRSFGETVTDLNSLFEAISFYTSNACEKLRSQHSCARSIQVFLEALSANPQAGSGVRHSYSCVRELFFATNDTPQIIQAAKDGVKELFIENCRYKKCGIILLDFLPENEVAPDLFCSNFNPKRRHLARVVDSVNAYYGKESLFYGATGIQRQWRNRSERRSPRYTTSWDDLATVH